MNISILCSDKLHPIYPKLEKWKLSQQRHHSVALVSRKTELTSGDLLFLISCQEIIDASVRQNFSKTLVIHASDLPKGRGWSPHIWQLLEGQLEIVVTLLEAADSVDTGDIWKKLPIHITRHELADEINEKLFDAELKLMTFAVDNFQTVHPQPQTNTDATYYPKRSTVDSRIDPHKSIADQFDLIRISDPNRYPAFFDLHGHRYIIRLEKYDSPRD